VVTHYSSKAVSVVFSGIHEEPKVTLPEVAHSLLERKQDFLAKFRKMEANGKGIRTS
jgi:hypothetical protein